MITETKGYKTVSKSGDVQLHATLEAAQQYAIRELFMECGVNHSDSAALADNVLKKKSELMTILTGQRGKDKQPRKRKAVQEVVA